MHISRTNPYGITPAAVPQRPAAPAVPSVPSLASPVSPGKPATAAGASLWNLLTPEEQEFFARQSELGALTYGPSSSGKPATPASHAPLGGRIDVRG